MHATEITRTRQHGTKVTHPTTPQERIDAIRSIVTNCQYAKVDGIMVDLFSASAIVAVYDALSEKNRVHFSSMPAGKMAVLAFRLVK